MSLVALPSTTNYCVEHVQEVETFNQFQYGQISEEDAIRFLVTILPDFTTHEDDPCILTYFAQKTLQNCNYYIKKADHQRGWSGNHVFKVKKHGVKETQCYLKVFPRDNKAFLPEMFGLSYMQNVQEINCPKILNIGQCHRNNKDFFLVLEEKAPGHSIQDYIEKVGACSTYTKDRAQRLIELLKASERFGQALARFHKSTLVEDKVFPQHFKDLIMNTFDKAVLSLEENPVEGIDILSLKAYVDESLNLMHCEDHLYSFTHDDIKTIHAFYDPKSNLVSLVNPHILSLSIDQDFKPIGLPLKDYYQYLLSIQLNRFGYEKDYDDQVIKKELLTLLEVELVNNAFEESYQSIIKKDLTETETNFFQLRHDLSFIANRHRPGVSSVEAVRIQDLAEISIENIKNKLKEMN
ncbi:MAG: hypothetical protein JHC93_06270 [Parachlamydiales bacterium]|nr:hypothetical protein [Parachlamydiales bacterium]